MILFWRVRFVDTGERAFKDRDLWLRTAELDATTRASLEACYELTRGQSHNREMLRFRALFRESPHPQGNASEHDSFGTIFLPDYCEDEHGAELTRKQIAVALTGSDTAVLLPSGAKQHDIEYMLANSPPIDLNAVHFSPEQINLLAYFARDLRELAGTAFLREGAGTLSGSTGPVDSQPAGMTVQTAVTDEEIRSFVTIFRRLYMEKEPANLKKAANLVGNTLGKHRLGKWIVASSQDLTTQFDAPPDFVPFLTCGKLTFTRKRLIDVFLYTQYAHQPDERRLRQFGECLRSLGGDRDVFTFLFLTEIWRVATQMRNIGQQVVQFFEAYCSHHKVACDVVMSPGNVHPGIGVLETKQERADRILQEKAEQLARSIWEQAGRPEGGHDLFFDQALAQLKSSMEASNASQQR